MTIDQFPVEGLKLITLKSYADDRGFFCERFKFSHFQEVGLPTKLVQDNFSRSNANVLRGLHYQWGPDQGKLVTCLSGEIMDVAVDIRQGSKTFGQVTVIELKGEKPQWFWIPAGFAHGFYVLGNQSADVLYKCDAEYSPKTEGGIRWDDPTLNVKWPTKAPQVSARDRVMQSFEDYKKNPIFKVQSL